MPSTLVHAALAGLLACALLGRAFSARSLTVVVAAVVLVDFDVFAGFVVLGAHRAAFHTLLWPALALGFVGYDVLVRDDSWLVGRFGETAPRVAVVTVAAVVLAAIGPDLVTNGVNLLYPLHDQFYTVDGKARFSTRDGLVQTFVEAPKPDDTVATTQNRQYRTGIDPKPSNAAPERAPERVFLLVGSGLQLLVVATGALVSGTRLWEWKGNA